MNKFKKLINAIIYSNDNLNDMNTSLKQVNTTTNQQKTTNELVITNALQKFKNNDEQSNDLIKNLHKLLEMSDIDHTASTTILNGLK
jgi:hypothetical protein